MAKQPHQSSNLVSISTNPVDKPTAHSDGFLQGDTTVTLYLAIVGCVRVCVRVPHSEAERQFFIRGILAISLPTDYLPGTRICLFL